MYLRIGTRSSKLALLQTKKVIEKITQCCPDIALEMIPIVTTGDKILNKNLYDIGGKALFLKEIEIALLDGKIDIAVHSLKDVPGRMHEELQISAVLQRDQSEDVLISKNAKCINDLPTNAVVGSSSMRRKVFLKNIRPDLNITTFRGNVHSRIRKFLSGEVDATILSAAGLNRLDIFDSQYCHIIPIDQVLPAAGQAVIAIETRINEYTEITNLINHCPTFHLIAAERSFIEYLNASCDTPIAAYATFTSDNRVRLKCMISDGCNVLMHTEVSDKINKCTMLEQIAQLGVNAAKEITSLL